MSVWSPLFAENGSETKTIVALIVAFLTGGGLFKVLDWAANRRDKNRTEAEKVADKKRQDDREDEDRKRREMLDDEERHYKRLEAYCKRLEEEQGRLEAECKQMVERATKAERRADRAVAYLKHHEAKLTKLEEDFVPWSEANGGSVQMHGPENPP